MESPVRHEKSMDFEQEQLLDSDHRLEEAIHPQKPAGLSSEKSNSKRWKRALMKSSIAMHVILLLTNVFFFVELVRRSQKSSTHTSSTFYSPAQGAIVYETRPVDGIAKGSIFAGYPNPKSDAAWNALLEGCINLKVFPDEMSKLDQVSLELKDGTGYLGALGVYHELHCIKRLRKWFYRDYYYPNATELEYNERMTHAEHCIEFIRQASVCHGDITLTSFKWLHDANGRAVEPTTKEGALHQCVQWDSLSDWAKSRRLDLFDPNLLVPEHA
ncbi:hypothetical protein GGS21DRAFT_486918 [Xylaria nigripes]|nr:hypothetical protein GGS21DRAFT_486918 [Xylaria nigripes]